MTTPDHTLYLREGDLRTDGRVRRVVGVTGRVDHSGDVVDAMMAWVTWERRGRP